MVSWWVWVSKTTNPLLQTVAVISPSCTAGKGQITVRNAPLPTWHRGSVSGWFAGIQTRSSCCDSSSALVGHGFWPQIERNLGMETKTASLVQCLQRVRNAAQSRRRLFPAGAPSFAEQQGDARLSSGHTRVNCSALFICRHLLRGERQISYFPKGN